MKFILALLLTIWTVNCQRLIQDTDCFGEGSFSPNIRLKEVNAGAENFGLKVFGDIAKKYGKASFIMSPYSIWSVLKLAYYGAAGETEIELKNALGVPSKRDAFWASHLINLRRQLDQDTALSTFNQAYFADDVSLRQCAIGKVVGIKTLNFRNPSAAAKIINDDIDAATKGEIKNFVNGNYISNARFILINALYFEGTWENKFDITKTVDAEFFDENGTPTTKKARMMETKSQFNYAQSDTLGAEIVELPYEGTNFAMYVILPNNGETVTAVLNRLTATTLNQTINRLRSHNIVTVNLPAFNFTTKIDRLLRESLNNLQITSLFDPIRANLRDFVPDEALAVSNALHQATIRVDEKGTVASAVTSLLATRSKTALKFNANKPFLFLIRDMKNDITYFIGVYRDPKHSIEA